MVILKEIIVLFLRHTHGCGQNHTMIDRTLQLQPYGIHSCHNNYATFSVNMFLEKLAC